MVPHQNLTDKVSEALDALSELKKSLELIRLCSEIHDDREDNSREGIRISLLLDSYWGTADMWIDEASAPLKTLVKGLKKGSSEEKSASDT